MADGKMKMTVALVEVDHLDRLKQQLDRIEYKLDKMIAALAEGDDDTVTGLDGGREFAPRDDRKGLG